MPDQKLTELPPLVGAPAPGDLLYVVDVDDPTDSPAGSSRRVAVSELFGGVSAFLRGDVANLDVPVLTFVGAVGAIGGAGAPTPGTLALLKGGPGGSGAPDTAEPGAAGGRVELWGGSGGDGGSGFPGGPGGDGGAVLIHGGLATATTGGAGEGGLVRIQSGAETSEILVGNGYLDITAALTTFTGNLGVTGIVVATAFKGDGSQLTGLPPPPPSPPPDLSGYAKLAAANTFTLVNTFSAGVTCPDGPGAQPGERFGAGASAAGAFSTALGAGASAAGGNSVAVGNQAKSTGGNNAVAIGGGAQAGSGDSVAIGYLAATPSYTCVAIGRGANTGSSNGNIVIGNWAAGGEYAFVCVGVGASAGITGTAVGASAKSYGWSAFGYGAESSGLGSAAFGNTAKATHHDSTCIGANAAAESAGDVALGGCYAAGNYPAVRTLRMVGVDSTTRSITLGGFEFRWLDPIHAVRRAAVRHLIHDAATGREYLQADTDGTNARIGFLGATAIARPTITGSRGGNAALASLLTQLAALGLIVDGSSA